MRALARSHTGSAEWHLVIHARLLAAWRGLVLRERLQNCISLLLLLLAADADYDDDVRLLPTPSLQAVRWRRVRVRTLTRPANRRVYTRVAVWLIGAMISGVRFGDGGMIYADCPSTYCEVEHERAATLDDTGTCELRNLVYLVWHIHHTIAANAMPFLWPRVNGRHKNLCVIWISTESNCILFEVGVRRAADKECIWAVSINFFWKL